ncbi:MAG: hypothetical protein GXP45_04620 [bacterium]|nr:hypothetical protein [bacterium]
METNKTLKELYQEFLEQKNKISKDSIEVLGKYVLPTVYIVVMFVAIMIIAIWTVFILIPETLQYMKNDLIMGSVSMGLLVFLFAIIVWFFIYMLKQSKEVYRKKKTFHKEKGLVADAQASALEIHERLKEVFIETLKESLISRGFEGIDSMSFPLGKQNFYDPKSLEVPSISFFKKIHQGSKTFEGAKMFFKEVPDGGVFLKLYFKETESVPIHISASK